MCTSWLMNLVLESSAGGLMLQPALMPVRPSTPDAPAMPVEPATPAAPLLPCAPALPPFAAAPLAPVMPPVVALLPAPLFAPAVLLLLPAVPVEPPELAPEVEAVPAAPESA